MKNKPKKNSDSEEEKEEKDKVEQLPKKRGRPAYKPFDLPSMMPLKKVTDDVDSGSKNKAVANKGAQRKLEDFANIDEGGTPIVDAPTNPTNLTTPVKLSKFSLESGLDTILEESLGRSGSSTVVKNFSRFNLRSEEVTPAKE